MSHLLSEARDKVATCRGRFDAAKVVWRDKKTAAAAAQAVAAAEQYARAAEISRGGPRPAPGHVPPKTAASIAADAAQAVFDGAERAMNGAQSALSAAEATLLSLENRILNNWRNARAREIRQLQLDGAPDEVLTAKLQELKVMCPPDAAVRINQKFSLSTLVREILDEHGDVLQITTPVDQLRGGGGSGYERRRAQILAQAETESASPLEAA